MVLCTLFCLLQNVRRAICTRLLTNKFVASLHLIIWTAGFFEDVNTRFRGDFNIAMTEVIEKLQGSGEVFADAKVKLHCSEVYADAQVKLSLPTLPLGKTSLSKITSLT